MKNHPHPNADTSGPTCEARLIWASGRESNPGISAWWVERASSPHRTAKGIIWLKS